MTTARLPLDAGVWTFRGETAGASVIAGYSGNSVETAANGTDKCVIAGGGSASYLNTIGADSSLAVIGGGYDNQIGNTASGIASGIPCGAHHRIDATHAVVVGGSYGTVNDFGEYGAIVGGTQNEIGDGVTSLSGTYAAILGGNSNTLTGRNAVILAGTSCTVGGAYGLAQGNASQANGTHAVAMGRFCTASAAGAWMIGNADGGSGVSNGAAYSWKSQFTGGYTFNGGDAVFAGAVTGTGGVSLGAGRTMGGGGVAKTITDGGSDTWTFAGFGMDARAARLLVSAGKSGGSLDDRSWWEVTIAGDTGAVSIVASQVHDGSSGTFQTEAAPFSVAVSGSDYVLTYTVGHASNTVDHVVTVYSAVASSGGKSFS